VGSRSRKARWETLTPARLLGITAWLLVAEAGAVITFLMAGFGSGALLGEPEKAEFLRKSARLDLLAGALGAAGPWTVWFLRRRRSWLIAGGIAAAIAMIAFVIHLTRSFSAPSIHEALPL